MSDLIRDTVLGHFLRLVTGNKVLLYAEEKDPEIWRKYVNKDKSANMATHGQLQPPEKDEGNEKDENDTTQRRSPSPAGSAGSSSTARDDSAQVNEASGRQIDSETGKDSFVVDWYGPDDPEVCDRTVRWRNSILMDSRILGIGHDQRDFG